MKKETLYKSLQERNADLQAELDKNNKVLNDIDSGVLFSEEENTSDYKFQMFELSPNNYVLHKGKPYQLDSHDIYNLDSTDCDDIKPMLLTDNILNSYQILSSSEDETKCDVFTFIETENGFYLSDREGNILSKPLKYVHQFQNLFQSLYLREIYFIFN
ncbi:hypothetical protein MG290_14735 (plasmid) [Flavobacterium sp. CBA20B-1]|uniref:hypothetical protein n=1 Tax=unclassified Flavobacterium TaxID=196869 RepID=UPI00222441F4|nr:MULTISPECIES: hypothetical protein [unclassified Flavobacterium]WCM43618.1 hypothetical protein MG290_14735 [Flavobacterium sp. CBA20B-1]